MTDILGPADAPHASTVRPADSRATFGGLDTWFVDCTTGTSEDGTDIESGWLNALIAQMRTVIRGNGNTGAAAPVVSESNADDAMMLKGILHLIQRGQAIYAADTGAANAIAITLSPSPPELKTGMTIRAKMAATNTGPTTLTVAGFVKSVKRAGGTLIGGELIAGRVIEFVYDGTDFTITGGSAFVAPRVTIFTSSGTWTPDSKAVAADIECIGGGAGGAGAVGQDPYGFTGAGGGAGATARKRVATSGLAAQAVTVGAGGAGGDGTAGVGGVNGTDGGASSVGALCSAGGGFKPHDFGYYPQLIPAAIGGKGGVASGGDLNIPGGDGSGTLAAYVQADAYGGTGGASSLGGGGAGSGNPQTGSQPALSGYSPNAQGESYAPAQNGAPGRAYGSGGGGGAAGKTGSTSKGAAGAPGIVIITEHFA